MTRRIDAWSLRLFVSTARAGSIVRGAAQEHIAPSALSRRIGDLEHAFGTALFVRSPRGIELTDAGRLVLARGEQIDADLQSLVREVQQAEGGEVRGTVRLSANMSAVVGFLPERLSAFMATHPRVEVQLREEDTRDVIRACLDDRADVGVGVAVPVPAGLDAWHFATDPLQVVLPAAHALAGRKKLGFAQVLAQPLIGVHQGGALDRSLHERAQALQMRFAPAVSVSSFDAVCRMVEAGLGIAVIPQSAASAYAGNPRFALRALDESWAARELCLYALRKTPRLRAVEALIEAVKG